MVWLDLGCPVATTIPSHWNVGLVLHVHFDDFGWHFGNYIDRTLRSYPYSPITPMTPIDLGLILVLRFDGANVLLLHRCTGINVSPY